MNLTIKVHEKPIGNWRTGFTITIDITKDSYPHAPNLKGLQLVSPCIDEMTGKSRFKMSKKAIRELPEIVKMPFLYRYQTMKRKDAIGICDNDNNFTYLLLVPAGYLADDYFIEKEFWVDNRDVSTAIYELKKVPVILAEQLKNGLDNPAWPAQEFNFTKEAMEIQMQIQAMKTKPARRLIA